MLSVIDTELWLSAVVETEVTVGAVVSVVVVVSLPVVVSSSVEVVEEPPSLLLLQEMTVRLKRKRERIMRICLIGFLVSFGEPNI
ncbi:uncharacterized protein METZ01_LOCUS500448 [marine metagenome]|uniref:Uncharacterized protein n=1 Tax=marine metagenome TaxID=408172 RepID=A0A383DTF4_9ZZZZ